MTDNNYFFTSRSFPKDTQIKSAIVFLIWLLILTCQEPFSRVACETLTTTNKVVLAGEVRGPKIKNDELIEKVRECIKDIGYDQDGLVGKTANIGPSAPQS